MLQQTSSSTAIPPSALPITNVPGQNYQALSPPPPSDSRDIVIPNAATPEPAAASTLSPGVIAATAVGGLVAIAAVLSVAAIIARKRRAEADAAGTAAGGAGLRGPRAASYSVPGGVLQAEDTLGPNQSDEIRRNSSRQQQTDLDTVMRDLMGPEASRPPLHGASSTISNPTFVVGDALAQEEQALPEHVVAHRDESGGRSSRGADDSRPPSLAEIYGVEIPVRRSLVGPGSGNGRWGSSRRLQPDEIVFEEEDDDATGASGRHSSRLLMRVASGGGSGSGRSSRRIHPSSDSGVPLAPSDVAGGENMIPSAQPPQQSQRWADSVPLPGLRGRPHSSSGAYPGATGGEALVDVSRAEEDAINDNKEGGVAARHLQRHSSYGSGSGSGRARGPPLLLPPSRAATYGVGGGIDGASESGAGLRPGPGSFRAATGAPPLPPRQRVSGWSGSGAFPSMPAERHDLHRTDSGGRKGGVGIGSSAETRQNMGRVSSSGQLSQTLRAVARSSSLGKMAPAAMLVSGGGEGLSRRQDEEGPSATLPRETSASESGAMNYGRLSSSGRPPVLEVLDLPEDGGFDGGGPSLEGDRPKAIRPPSMVAGVSPPALGRRSQQQLRQQEAANERGARSNSELLLQSPAPLDMGAGSSQGATVPDEAESTSMMQWLVLGSPASGTPRLRKVTKQGAASRAWD